ncbi:MAG: flagellar biosynthetic protein FliO [Lachnospiraceae bacterium]|nr:flagellar biosynthetic protein FliO [Lachnospiraceae bacterium]
MLLSINSGIDSVVQFLTVLVIFVFVLGMTYVTTRYIAGIQKKQLKTGNMELVETLRISSNKYLQIVRIGNKYLCMAVCKDTVTMLGEIQREDLVFPDNRVEVKMDFQTVLENIKQKQWNKKTDTNGEKRH